MNATAKANRRTLMRQVWAVAVCAAALSVWALVQVALDAGVPHWTLALAFPFCLDGLVVVAVQAALSPAYGPGVRAFAWLAVVPALGATVWANVVHYPAAPVIAVTPPVAFVLTAILAALMTREPPPAARPAPKPRPKATRATPVTPANPPTAPTTTPKPDKGPNATEQQRAVFDRHLAAGTADTLTGPQLMEQAGVGGKRLAQRNLSAWKAEHSIGTTDNGHRPTTEKPEEVTTA